MLDVKLDTLLAVYETKSFTRAAEKLALTQPAVSHHISMLEKELSSKLFFRSGKEFRPTPAGETAIKYARRLKAMSKKMERDIRDSEKNMTRIRVGITHTAESNIIAEVLAKFGALQKNISITVFTDSINNLYDKLENFEIDIAVAEGKRLSPDLNYLMLDTDFLVCVLSPENRLAKNSSVTLNELRGEHMILRLPSSATRRLFEATLVSINESIENFNVTLEVDNISTIKDLVRKGLGISILPHSACMDEIKKGKLIALPLENLSMMREVNIIYAKDFSRIDILRSLCDIYKEAARD